MYFSLKGNGVHRKDYYSKKDFFQASVKHKSLVFHSRTTQKIVVYGTTQNIKQQAFFLIMFSFGGRWSYGVVLYEIFTIGR